MMQPISRSTFLQSVSFGALSVPMMGNLSLVPLARFGSLPPTVNAPVSFGSVENQARKLLSGYNLPGMAIGLIRDKKLVYARGFGVQSVVTRKPMTEYSVTMIASMAKMFTGTAIMQLQEAGRLNLDDTFVRHVPYFKMVDPRYEAITIRHLLSHTSGIPENSGADFLGPWQNPWLGDDSAERLVRSLDGGAVLSQDPGGPGAVFRYSDLGYNILAALVHKVTGELFEDYQRIHLFEPLHMSKTTYIKIQVKPNNLMSAHTRDADGNPVPWDRYPYTRQYGPAGCLFTNIVDMSNWVIANLNGGLLYNRIIHPDTQSKLWVSLCNDPWGWPGVGYNSGYWIMNYAESGIGSVRMILGVGAAPGVNTHLTIFPDQGLAAIVFVNLCAKPGDPAYAWGFCDSLAIQMLRGEL
jgi:CubicO group peptidase (beta-lactamase class C family)